MPFVPETRSKKLETHVAIRQLTDPAEVEAAGLVLGRSLAPSWSDTLPDPAECLAYCTLLYTANTRWTFDRGTVWIASLPDVPIAGALSLIPHPEPEWSDEDDARYGYDQLAGWQERMTGEAPDEDDAHAPLNAIPGPWTYVNVLGVTPEHQGQGIGTALMQHAIAEADAAGLPMGLITDTVRNVRFYSRLGFEVVQEGTEGPPLVLWTMIRRSQS
jgi:GNAT superfamily N-acetyltransferase